MTNKKVENAFKQAYSPVQSFIDSQSSSGILLIIATSLALILANSPYSQIYHQLLHFDVGFIFENMEFTLSIRHWINDGLMVILFLLLGLEIKREILVGELSSLSQASTVIFAALGGIIVPALIYISLTYGDNNAVQGWGIPMATDTAFVLGLLALLGKKHVPSTAKIFLVGIAIVDDIGAVLVIALFYTDVINTQQLFFAGVCFGLLLLSNYLGIRHVLLYVLLGIIFWLFIYQAGIHGTVAGVLLALTIPARPDKRQSLFTEETRKLINKIDDSDKSMLESEKKHEQVERIEEKVVGVTTPLQRWESALQNPVNLMIIPLFAFFNAGITINTERIQLAMDSSILMAILLALVIGKPLGIIVFTLACIRSKLGTLSDDLNIHHVISLGILAGMGFTMSIFIATLAFNTNDALEISKLGILFATTIAGFFGMLWMLYASRIN